MHVLHNILPVLNLQCLNVRPCVTLRLSDMTENALYMHLDSTEVS